MNLYDDRHKKVIQNINDEFKYVDLNDKIKAINNPNIIVSSETVVVAELTYLREAAFKFINTHLKHKCKLVGNIKRGFKNVQYFLAVPGIYSFFNILYIYIFIYI